MNNYIFIIFIIALAIAIILAYYYAKRWTKPLVDMRNITTDIANLDFSKQCKIESEDKSYFYNMLSQIDAMSELISGLLEISRLESESSLKKEIFDLSSSMLKVHRQLKYLAQEKQIEVQMDLVESLAKGDRLKIETVMRNIYSNAIFYTHKGEHISILIQKQEGNWVCAIENAGVKIEEEELEKIWEAFYRIDQSRNKALGGSGLGLYIVQQILDKHDSYYGIENTKVGVKVWFTLESIKTI